MNAVTKININSLSLSERILLAEKLWDSVAEDQDTLEVTKSQKLILEERLADYGTSDQEGFTWDEIKAEMI